MQSSLRTCMKSEIVVQQKSESRVSSLRQPSQCTQANRTERGCWACRELEEKNECLRWTRRCFEEVLGWTSGVQFQMVAPQHTMALLIGGKTVHSWSQVPINATSMQSWGWQQKVSRA